MKIFLKFKIILPTFAALAINSVTASAWPFKHAICRGVFPYTFFASISAPDLINVCMHSTLPDAAAACNGVYKSRSLII